MKLTALASLIIILTLTGQQTIIAQNTGALRVAEIAPYDKAVPGQILELLAESPGDGMPPLMLSTEDFQIEVSQDGIKQQAKARTVTTTIIREPRAGKDAAGSASPGTEFEMRGYQSVGFVVPQGLHPGEAEIVLSFQKRRSNPIKLTIVERPLPPTVGGVATLTINPAGLPPPPMRGTIVKDIGWRLERGVKAEFRLRPLVDPEDASAAVLIRFKQGDAYHEAVARVVHHPRKTEVQGRGMHFAPARDVLEVEIPASLMMGEAEAEIRLRAGGQTSDAVKFKVAIADAARSTEASAENAPRLLAVTPRRVGVGQAVMLSVDYLRTLAPDASKTMILIEQGGTRYTIKPEMNSAVRRPNQEPDAPVFLTVRPTRQIIGAAQVRVLNPLRGEQGGMSAATPLEIVDEVLPPEIISVNEATAAELAPLRQMYEAQRAAGGTFQEYDPNSRYVTIRARGLDYNPRFVRIRFEQEGRSAILSPADFSLYGEERLIVRLPRDTKPGAIQISIENRGLETFSTPVTKMFELSGSK